MAGHIDVVNAIIAAWKNQDIDGVLNNMDENIEYHYMVGAKPLSGKSEMKAFLEKFGGGQENNRWRISNYAETEHAILLEGIDDYEKDDKHIQIPYMGIMKIKEGKVTQWRDYLDSALLSKAMEGGVLPPWLDSLVMENH